MKLFKSNKLKPSWEFNQNGNMWRFIFCGDNIIAGETRDIENKILYLFTIDFNNGKTFLKNFKFEEGNFWISIEGGNNSVLFLNRFQNPELPYHKNIIAIDIKSGEFYWENTDYEYFFNTKDKLFGITQKFENVELAEIDISNGKLIKVFTDEEAINIIELKKETDLDLFNESTDYPKPLSNQPLEDNLNSIIKAEISNRTTEGEIEYINFKNYLLFNYYYENGINLKDISRKYYRNNFCIYDAIKSEKVYQDTLNEKSNYNVPDNFFIKNDMLFYLKEKTHLIGLNLK